MTMTDENGNEQAKTQSDGRDEFWMDMKHDLNKLSKDHDGRNGYHCIPKVCMDGWVVHNFTTLN